MSFETAFGCEHLHFVVRIKRNQAIVLNVITLRREVYIVKFC